MPGVRKIKKTKKASVKAEIKDLEDDFDDDISPPPDLKLTKEKMPEIEDEDTPIEDLEDDYYLSLCKEYEKIRKQGERFKIIEKTLTDELGGRRVRMRDPKTKKKYILDWKRKKTVKLMLSVDENNEVVDPETDNISGTEIKDDE